MELKKKKCLEVKGGKVSYGKGYGSVEEVWDAWASDNGKCERTDGVKDTERRVDMRRTIGAEM